MKALSLQAFGLGLALSVVPFVAGCNPQSQSVPADTTNASTVAQAASLSDAAPAQTTAPPPALPVEKTIPEKINPSPSLLEVIKLARAGVEESVLLAFVNGSQSAFNLGSDEIIYLSDLGVPDEVMTAMMDRDHVLKQSWAPPAQVAEAEAGTPKYVETASEPVAAAPTYINDPQPAPEEQPQQVIVNNDYVYENLAPYGSWVNVSGYGVCWQPTVAVINSNWRPYCDRGRWAYTSAGWYWQSDYSWGATFQYGRWFNQPGRGWCWWPDRVWAPSWVTWRYNSSYCGWAPLPPTSYYQAGVGLSYVNGNVGVGFGFGLSSDCYTFVGWNNFCSPQPYRYCAPKSQNAFIAQNSTVINNYVKGDGNTIINHGVAPEQVTQYSGRPVPRTSLEEARTRRGPGWLANNNASAMRSPDSRSNRGPEAALNRASDRTSPDQADLGRRSNIGNLADARGSDAFRPSASAARSPSQTLASNSQAQTQDKNGGQIRTSPPAQRDRRADRDITSPRPGIPEHSNRRAPLIVNGSDSSASRGLAATPETAPAGALILKGEPNNNSSRRDNGRYVPPSTDRRIAANAQRNVATSRTETQPAQARASTPQTALPQRATAWTPPQAQRVQSPDNIRSQSRGERPFQAAPQQRSNPARQFSSPTPSATPAFAPRPAPQQVRSAPAPAPARQRVSAPSVQSSRRSPTVVQSAPRIESAPRPSAPSSSARQSPGRSGWDNRTR